METHLGKLERREQSLIAKCELQEGRLGQGAEAREEKAGKVRKASGNGTGAEADAGREARALRLKALRQKKERLGYVVERLTLQSQQRQRQLRMSIAAT